MEAVKYALIPMLWAASSVAIIIYLIKWAIWRLAGKTTRKIKRRLLVSVGCMVGTFAIIASYPTKDTPEKAEAKPATTEVAKEEPKKEKTPKPEASEKKKGWQDKLPAHLVKEIEAAFTEIDEDPGNIVNVEYVDTHTSGYIFEQKCYKVEFSYSFLNPGWKHSKEYRIVTQNYFEGEPEKEEYPDEFLATIKYWAGDDGHGTNINQWTWTGNGEKQ